MGLPCKYMENATVHAMGEIRMDSIVNCDIAARGKVVVKTGLLYAIDGDLGHGVKGRGHNLLLGRCGYLELHLLLIRVSVRRAALSVRPNYNGGKQDMKKRILAVILASVLVLSVGTVSAFAHGHGHGGRGYHPLMEIWAMG